MSKEPTESLLNCTISSPAGRRLTLPEDDVIDVMFDCGCDDLANVTSRRRVHTTLDER